MKVLISKLNSIVSKSKETIQSNSNEIIKKAELFASESKEAVVDQSIEAKNRIQNELTSKLNTVFDDVLNEPIPDEKLKSLIEQGRGASEDLIAKASNRNMMIAGGCSLVPGPWGLISVIPEIYLVTKNQINLIKDLSIAYGYKEKLNRELLMFLFASSVGVGSIGLATIHGSKILVKRSGLRVLQKIVAAMGGKVSQQALKVTVSRWLPIVGAGVMAAWSKYSTKKVGEICCELLEKEISISNEEINDIDIEEVVNDAFDEKVNLESLKILINLAKIDGLSSIEIDFIKSKIEALCKSPDVKNEILLKLMSDENLDIDYSIFSSDIDKALLIENLNNLATFDQLVTSDEKHYIDEVKRKLKF
ncbi:MAG: hypothetical protein ACK5D8_07180 [Bacteroidota bacterium]